MKNNPIKANIDRSTTMQQEQSWKGCFIPFLCNQPPEKLRPQEETLDITDSFQKLSLQSVFINESAEIICDQFDCGKPLGETDMAKMSFEEVADYIGTLRSTIKKLQDIKPQHDISDLSEECD